MSDCENKTPNVGENAFSSSVEQDGQSRASRRLAGEEEDIANIYPPSLPRLRSDHLPIDEHKSDPFLWMMARWCVGWPAAARGGRDELTWQAELTAHAAGEFSMAAAQANAVMEDQAQVMASPGATLVGVYDGHGGPDASRFLRSRLFPLLHEFAAERGGAVDADVIRKTFLAADEEYLQLLRWSLPNMSRAAASGSCCLLGAISGDTLYVANAGDSRAVLGRRAAAGQTVAERLSTEHNVASEEVRRELAALHPDDGEVVVHARGAWRVKGIIQVARAIGDVYLKTPEFKRDPAVQRLCSSRAAAVELARPVVTAEPSIHARKLKAGVDLFVVFASDGLWEHLSDEAAVQLVSKSSTRRGVAARLVQAALGEAARKREVRRGDLQRIERGVRRHFHDDITAVVVFLDLDDDGGRRARRRGRVVDSSSSSCSNTPLDVYSLYNSTA
uniref:protein-serine/threonine phosphatase n=1 Tax=Oryza glumipatula TaxID=40148 RepID=A0A0E0AF64_9ORYZ